MVPTVVIRRDLRPSLAVSFGTTSSPYVLVGRPEVEIQVSTSLAVIPSLALVKSLHLPVSVTFGILPSVIRARHVPRSLAATLGFDPAVSVVQQLNRPVAVSLGMHVTVSVVKNAVNNRGMVVMT
jgi:hypothetical protein